MAKDTAQARYDKKNTIFVGVKVIRTTEADIVKKLSEVPNKAGYIKSLIRADIEKEKEKNQEA